MFGSPEVGVLGLGGQECEDTGNSQSLLLPHQVVGLVVWLPDELPVSCRQRCVSPPHQDIPRWGWRAPGIAPNTRWFLMFSNE